MDKKKLSKILLILSQVFFGLFVILIILLLTVDKKAIGPNESVIGLSTINQAVFNRFSENRTCILISKYLGYVALGVVGLMALFGLMQLISRKKLLGVDIEILLLGLFYIICGLVYVFFYFVVINYRPIFLMDEAGELYLEGSFPSSHTILGVFVFASLGLVLKKYIKIKYLRISLEIVCYLLACTMLVTRLISGIHWFTDILGSFLLSMFLLLMFKLMLNINEDLQKKQEN